MFEICFKNAWGNQFNAKLPGTHLYMWYIIYQDQSSCTFTGNEMHLHVQRISSFKIDIFKMYIDNVYYVNNTIDWKSCQYIFIRGFFYTQLIKKLINVYIYSNIHTFNSQSNTLCSYFWFDFDIIWIV